MIPPRSLTSLLLAALLWAPTRARCAAPGEGQSQADKVKALTFNWIPAKDHDFRTFARPTLFLSYASAGDKLQTDAVMGELAARGAMADRLAAALRQGRRKGEKLPAVILDCQGHWSAGLAVELRRKAGFQIVPLLNGTAGDDGALDPGAARTLAALAGLRAEAGRSADSRSPPAFLLDRSRLASGARTRGSLVLPGADFFLEKGLSSVVYVHDSEAEGRNAWAADLAERLGRLRPGLKVVTVGLDSLR